MSKRSDARSQDLQQMKANGFHVRCAVDVNIGAPVLSGLNNGDVQHLETACSGNFGSSDASQASVNLPFECDSGVVRSDRPTAMFCYICGERDEVRMV